MELGKFEVCDQVFGLADYGESRGMSSRGSGKRRACSLTLVLMQPFFKRNVDERTGGDLDE